jgi:uncharacterized protein YjbJ (UPF0337 family)
MEADMDKEHAKGAAKDLKGKAKEAAGKATGSRKTEVEGKADQAEGRPIKRQATSRTRCLAAAFAPPVQSRVPSANQPEAKLPSPEAVMLGHRFASMRPA